MNTQFSEFTINALDRYKNEVLHIVNNQSVLQAVKFIYDKRLGCSLQQIRDYVDYVSTEDYQKHQVFLKKATDNHNTLLSALKGLLASYRADFEAITGSPLNNTESVLKALAAIKGAE